MFERLLTFGATRGHETAARAGGMAPLLTMAQTAEALGIPEYSCRALGRSGELPVVRLGRSVRVDPIALREFIARRSGAA